MNRKGFAPIEMLVAVMILGAIVLGGVYLYTRNQTRVQIPTTIPVLTPAAPTSSVSKATSTPVVVVLPPTTQQIPQSSLEKGRQILGQCGNIVSTSTADAIGSGKYDLYIQSSSMIGWKIELFPLFDYGVSGYCMSYPEKWQAHVVGANWINLVLDTSSTTPYPDSTLRSTASNQILFLQIAQGNLTLKDGDNTEYGQDDFGSPPAKNQPETILYNQIEFIGGKQVLVRKSEKNNVIYNRYVLTRPNSIYVFQSSAPKELADTAAYASFLSDVMEIVSSTRFVR